MTLFFHNLWSGCLALLLSLCHAVLYPFKWIHRQFTLWRLRPSRMSLLDAYGHGRLTSSLLHKLDADILRRGGLAALWMLLFCVALLTGPNVRAQLTNINYPNYQSGQPNFFYNDTNYASFVSLAGAGQSWTAGATNAYIKTIRQNQGLSLFLAVWSTNTAASTTTNYTVKFDVTGDGYTWTAGNGAQPFIWTVPLAGKTPGTNVFWTNIPASTLSNVRKMQATAVTATASNNVYAALGYSQSTQ
jgi:hypothetical protein